jgi:CubicO group peptidase (beta-lactamase class C family)
MNSMLKKCFYYIFIFSLVYSGSAYSEKIYPRKVNQIVNKTIQELMQKNSIPGIAVAILYQGHHRYFTYGVINVEHNIPVTEHSLFEIGSVSKTFTGVLGGDTLARGEINLNDPARYYWPALIASQWNTINLLQLATYTAGGLPWKIPAHITNESSLLDFYNTWKPDWEPGVKRLYGDASIGLFGILAIRPSGMSFEKALKTRVLQHLKMNNTWVNVPEEYQRHYSWGYSNNKPVRLFPGILAAKTYGLISTVRDMANWVHANMHPEKVQHETLQQGIKLAQSRYWRIGSMYQGLGWDIFNWPAEPGAVIYCSNRNVALKPQTAVAITPPAPLVKTSWVHKTGSTRGFGAYVAFIPEKQIGIVLLANKNYPNADRINAAYTILNALSGEPY